MTSGIDSWGSNITSFICKRYPCNAATASCGDEDYRMVKSLSYNVSISRDVVCVRQSSLHTLPWYVIPKVSQIISVESWDKNKRALPAFWAYSTIGWVADSEQRDNVVRVSLSPLFSFFILFYNYIYIKIWTWQHELKCYRYLPFTHVLF